VKSLSLARVVVTAAAGGYLLSASTLLRSDSDESPPVPIVWLALPASTVSIVSFRFYTQQQNSLFVRASCFSGNEFSDSGDDRRLTPFKSSRPPFLLLCGLHGMQLIWCATFFLPIPFLPVSQTLFALRSISEFPLYRNRIVSSEIFVPSMLRHSYRAAVLTISGFG